MREVGWTGEMFPIVVWLVGRSIRALTTLPFVYVNAIRLKFVNIVSSGLSMVNSDQSLTIGIVDTGRKLLFTPGTISSAQTQGALTSFILSAKY